MKIGIQKKMEDVRWKVKVQVQGDKLLEMGEGRRYWGKRGMGRWLSYVQQYVYILCCGRVKCGR